MASDDPDVLCGRFAFSWTGLAGVANFFMQTGLSDSMTRRTRSYNVSLMEDLRMKSEQLLLHSALWLTRSYASTDPQDRIFTLYGVVDPCEHELLASRLLQVDYQKPVQDEFRDMMFGVHQPLSLAEANERS
jgi:hypothetical protein